MPHFIIEYSGNLDDAVDMQSLCEAVRAEAARIETFPLAGIRVRALRVDHVAMADGDPKHGFVDVSIRLRAGRTPEVKAEATRRIFDAAHKVLAPVMAERSLALSIEMRDIDPDLSLKTGSVRDHMEA